VYLIRQLKFERLPKETNLGTSDSKAIQSNIPEISHSRCDSEQKESTEYSMLSSWRLIQYEIEYEIQN